MQLTSGNSQKSENTSATQQIATTRLSPAGGGVRRTGVDLSQRTENNHESQQNATKEQSPLPQRGVVQAKNDPKSQQNATKMLLSLPEQFLTQA